MQEVEQQHAPEVEKRLTQQLIGHKRKSYMHRDETIVAIPENMKDVLFTPYLRNHDWRWICDRQTEFADKGFVKQLLKLLDLCGPDIQTICDLTVGCGGALLPLLHERPVLRAVAFDQSSQCIKACLHNAACLNLKPRYALQRPQCITLTFVQTTDLLRAVNGQKQCSIWQATGAWLCWTCRGTPS